MKSLIVLAVCMLPSLFANAQTVNKGLDPSFGNKGIQYTEPYAGGNMKHAYQLALTNDGKIMVAGSYLMRLKADGTPDSSFADYGFYEPPTFYSATQPFPRPGKTSSFLLMPDGKIIATIYAWADLNGVMRLFPDGKVDSGFGDKGYLKIDYGTAQYSLIQSDGKILVAGDQNNAPYSYVIHRFNADWSVDSAFGTHGIAKMESGIYQGEVAGLGIMANGRIIIGGTGYDTSSRRAEVIQRYLPSGQPDSTFGGTGEIIPSTQTTATTPISTPMANPCLPWAASVATAMWAGSRRTEPETAASASMALWLWTACKSRVSYPCPTAGFYAAVP